MGMSEVLQAKVDAYGTYMALGWKSKLVNVIKPGDRVTVSAALNGVNFYINGELQGWGSLHSAMVYALDWLIENALDKGDE